MRKLMRWVLIAFCLGVLTGFVPTFLVARQRQLALDQSHSALDAATMHLKLSEAALDARRAKYELAREELSQFFSAVQKESDHATGNLFRDPARIQQLLNQRDEFITLLARSDPASADRLSNLELEFRQDTQLK